MRTKLVAGNWKMHGSNAISAALLPALAAGRMSGVDILVCPPFPYLADAVARLAGQGIAVGAQDVSAHAHAGAYTGEVSAAMLVDVGCRYALVGHSERRAYHHESNAEVAAKFVRARDAGLHPIACVGETLEDRQAGRTEAVISAQLDAVFDAAGTAWAGAVIGYEPKWAIGTGHVASPEQAQQVHAFIRSQLATRDAKLSELTRILYGGSVKPGNAHDLFAMPDVDGGLIGGASLTAADFLAICRAALPAASE